MSRSVKGLMIKRKWSFEKCRNSAAKYSSRFEWYENDEAAYRAAKRGGWFEDCVRDLPQSPKQHRKSLKNKKWSLELCLKTTHGHSTYSDWTKENRGGMRAAIRNGWVDEIKRTFGSNVYCKWPLEKCVESALGFDSKVDWMKNEKSAYNAAFNSGWMDVCTSHMKKNIQWTYELCLASAKKYSRKGDWSKGASGAYSAAKRNGWFSECTSHMQ